jgi:septum site-determining protein MinC
MSTDSQKNADHSPILEFKSSTFSVPVLILATNNLISIEKQLQKKIHLAPDFFKNSPLVLDLQDLNKNNLDIDVTNLTHLIRRLDLLPIGIRGGTAQQNQQALKFGIPVHFGYSVNPVSRMKKQEIAKLKVPEVETIPTTIITRPIRSGQRIYASGDLIVLAQVSPGAEVLAEGNIHVYGSLRGRALAGVVGNTDARIFCSDLQAELISIAGNYKISENLDGVVPHQLVQIYLQNHTLVIKDI